IARIAGEVGKMPREVWPAARAHWSRPQSFHTMAEYLAELVNNANAVENASLGDLPLVVISAQGASNSELAEHRRIAALSTRGEHMVADTCGHWIHLDRPALVVDCVQGCWHSESRT